MRRTLLLGLSLVGCASVPDVTFSNPDASVADSASTTDGATPDSGTPAVCPTVPPSGADVCCGDIACSGNCDGDHCQACEDRCGSDEICCTTGNTVKCRSFGDGC